MQYLVLLLLFLGGCSSKAPSQTIVNNAQQEIVSIQETVKKIELQTPAACKTELFWPTWKLSAAKYQPLAGK